MIESEMVKRFSYHKPDEAKGMNHTEVRNSCFKLARDFDNLLKGESREKSLAITKIEEAMFWANAHLARN